MTKSFSFLIIALIVVFSACSSKNNYSRKPVTNILITPSKVVEQGNDFNIAVDVQIKNGKLKNIDLWVDDKLITSSNELSFSYSVKTDTFSCGNHSVRAIAYKTDGVNSTSSTNIFIPSDIKPKNIEFKIVKSFPHNTSYFTEGFEFLNNTLYESTGNQGSSFIVSYKPGNENPLKSVNLDYQYFGEGITILHDKIYQLTYKHKKGFVYDLNSFNKIGEFAFSSAEGWGLTNDGQYLIMSDGTSKISFIETQNFKVVKSIEVCDNKGIIDNINELEYVDSVIYANIWTKNTILKIDAETGKVLGYVNLESLLSQINTNSIDVLNGIAYQKNENLFYVTGKYWPKMFAIKFLQ